MGLAVSANYPAAAFGMISEYNKALEQIEDFVISLK
jgi:hypothetical protein